VGLVSARFTSQRPDGSALEFSLLSSDISYLRIVLSSDGLPAIAGSKPG
jgi:hypothetical protein